MKKFVQILSAASILLAMGEVGLAVTNFVTVKNPSADPGSTLLTGISGNIAVGNYQSGAGNDGFDDGGGFSHGFTYIQPSFKTLDDPAASAGGTLSYGVSGSTVVGEMVNTSGSHGFIYDGTSYTTLDDPNAAPGQTEAFGVSGSIVVGDYVDSANVTHGFSYSAGKFTTIDDPKGTVATQMFGYSNGRYVGTYDDATGFHGFTYDGTTFTTFDDPSASTGQTSAHGIDGNNIVGYFKNSTGNHGFLFDGTTYTTIDDPSATQGTDIFGISGNTIVGTYSDGTTPVLAYHGNGDEGFEATIPEPASLGLAAFAVVAVVRRRSHS